MTYPVTFDTTLATSAERRFNAGPVLAATAALLLGAMYLNAAVTWRHAALFLVGGAAGVVLYHAAFGFTTAWREFIVQGRGDGLRAQMLMLAAASLVFFPALASGHLFGQPVRGSISPVSVSVVAGAFLFGVGMQLGGGCASGTLYTSGGGNVRMLVTLLSFIAGSVLGLLQMPWWEKLPAYKPVSLVASLGAGWALAASLSAFALIAGVTWAVERRLGSEAGVGGGGRRRGSEARVGGEGRRRGSEAGVGGGGQTPIPARTVAAGGRRARTCRRQHRDAGARRTAVGRHRRVRVVGVQRARRRGHERGRVAVLVHAGACR